MSRATPKDKAYYSSAKAARRALGDGGFVPHTAELLKSAAWRARSIYLVRMLDRLEVEHMAHAGKENGFLQVTYDQFVEYGISRRFIRCTIEEGEQLGLLKVTARGFYAADGPIEGRPSMYQLLYLPWKYVPGIGAPQYLDPTHEWLRFTGPKPKRRAPRRRQTVLHLVPKN
jgi:hypothetical protein